ncbi:MAG: restriction endonuclease subunit S, partial [Actinobacteria bacterium]|nr:restriction endonuclease subunit S [Actinomycetota bacterium]
MEKTVKLKPYCKKIGSGITPRGGDSVYIDNGVALIRSQNVYNGTFLNQGLAFIDNDIAQRMKGVTVEKNDILLNITGDSVARCCIIPDAILPARVNQHVSIIRTYINELNPRFLMYFLISPLMQARMLSFAGSGGTRKALTKEMIENFDLPLIDCLTQKKIVSLLSVYDNLIDTTHRRIQLLEEAGRLLFREWFVYLRFPEYEKVSIFDSVPEGWRKGNISEFFDTASGGT